MKNKKEELEILKQEANQAYLNSISLNLCYSTDPHVKTRTSEAKRLSYLNEKIKRLESYIRFSEIESKLPDFTKMSDTEICDFIDASPMLHYCPVNTEGDYYEVIDDEYYGLVLAHNFYSEDGWVAQGCGVAITPRIYEYLKSRGF